MTSLIASGIESGRQSLQALAGLSTGDLYFLRLRKRRGSTLGTFVRYVKAFRKKRLYRMWPFYLKRMLGSLAYRYDRFVAIPAEEYDGLVERLCDLDPDIMSQLKRKRTSTGLIALALAIDRNEYQRFILSGFSFELTHPYGLNPEIEERGTAVSQHADTDIMVLRYLAKKQRNIYTTEHSVHEQAGVPFLPMAVEG